MKYLSNALTVLVAPRKNINGIIKKKVASVKYEIKSGIFRIDLF